MGQNPFSYGLKLLLIFILLRTLINHLVLISFILNLTKNIPFLFFLLMVEPITKDSPKFYFYFLCYKFHLSFMEIQDQSVKVSTHFSLIFSFKCPKPSSSQVLIFISFYFLIPLVLDLFKFMQHRSLKVLIL